MFSSYFCFCERANFSVYWTSRGPISRFIGLTEGQFPRLLDYQRANFLVYWTTREPIPSFFEPLHRQRTTRPLWRLSAGTPQGEVGRELRAIARGWGGAGSPSQRSGQHIRCRPCVAPRPRLRRGIPQMPGAPATPYTCRPVSNLPAWGRYQRPHYTVRRGLVGRPDGAKSAVGMCGPRVTQGPLPVGHAPLRATTVPGVCGPRGPPMAH